MTMSRYNKKMAICGISRWERQAEITKEGSATDGRDRTVHCRECHAIVEGQPPFDGRPLQSVTDRGNVAPEVTQHNAAAVGEPIPD